MAGLEGGEDAEQIERRLEQLLAVRLVRLLTPDEHLEYVRLADRLMILRRDCLDLRDPPSPRSVEPGVRAFALRPEAGSGRPR